MSREAQGIEITQKDGINMELWSRGKDDFLYTLKELSLKPVALQ